MKLRTLTLLALLLFILFASAYVFVGEINEDEGWYLYAANLVYEGNILYADFLFTQAPLMPYLYGLPQAALGSSLYVGRFTSLVLAFGLVLIVAAAARRLGGEFAAFIAVLALAFSPYALYHLTISKTYPLAAVLIGLAVWSLTAERQSFCRRLLAVIALTLAAATRLSVIAAVPALLLSFLIFDRERWGRVLLYGLVATVLFACIFLPFLITDANNTLFGLLGFHTVAYQAGNWFQYLYEKIDNIGSLVNNTVFLWLGALLWLCLFAVRRKSPFWQNLRERSVYVHLVVILVTIFLANFVPRATRFDYQIISLPPLVVLATVSIAKVYRELRHDVARRTLAALIIGIVLISALGGNHHLDLRGGNLPGKEIDELAEFLNEQLDPGEKVFTMHPYIAVAADRELLPGTEMAMFSYFPEWDRATCARHRVINDDIASEYIDSALAGAVILTAADFRRNSTLTSLDPRERERNAQEMLARIENRYRLALTMQSFGQWQETMYVYLRR